MRQLLRFPDMVNEKSARVVALGVVAQAVLFLVLTQGWLLLPLVYGFAARVVSGPTLSPLGQFAVRVATPRLPGPDRMVPGAPKRFAQLIGLTFTVVATVAWVLGAQTVTFVVLAALVAAATLEAVFSVCVGCIVYRFFWECVDCSDISERLAAAVEGGVPATN